MSVEYTVGVSVCQQGGNSENLIIQGMSKGCNWLLTWYFSQFDPSAAHMNIII
jgi:hypothetical protein